MIKMTETKIAKKKSKIIRQGHTKWTRDDTELTILAIPTTVWYILFCYLPMFGIVLAFKDYKIVDATKSFIYNLIHSDWAGFKNFEYFLTLRDFPQILRNTLLYNIVFIVLDVVLPVSLAIIISNIYSKRKSKTYQTLMFMPHFMSWVVISYFVYAFLVTDKGLLNSIIRAFGGENINWYFEPKYWPFILTIMHVWKVLGYSMVVYLASITGIDSSLYEAAVLDGASKFQQARYITLPMLKFILITMFILNIGRIFYSDFGLFWQVTQGLPNSLYNVASTFDTFIYSSIQNSTPIGRTAAASLFQSVCCCATVLLANFIVSKIDPESAII